jgi:hypothetical protein
MLGSIGDVTYCYNRYASIIARQKPIPTTQPTQHQLDWQAVHRASVLYWHTSKTLDRYSWELYAQATPRPLGISGTSPLPGFNMYLSVRLAALMYNGALNETTWDFASPVPGNCPLPHIIPVVPVQPGSVAFELHNRLSSGALSCTCWLSDPQPLTVNYFIGPYNFDLTTRPSPIDPLSSTSVQWNGMPDGSRYFMRLRTCSHDDYLKVSQYARCHYDL